MKAYAIVLAAAVCAFGTATAGAHGGKLDEYGCHHDAKTGGYHCHAGKNAGRQFKSKEEATARPKPTEPKRKKKSTTNENAKD